MSHHLQQSMDSGRYQGLYFPEGLLSLDKAKLETHIVYDTYFVCKVHLEALHDSVVSV